MSNRFVGTWRLVSFVGRSADGSETMDFGPTPHGCLMYDEGGRMSVHITHSDASLAYFGYFGRYTVGKNSGTVTHHIVGASDSKYAGTDQLRFFTLQGNRLVLSTAPADVTYVATWEREPADGLGRRKRPSSGQ